MTIVTENIDHIDFVFLIIYTWEMMMKIIAMGFFMRAHSYLRDSWNIVSASFFLVNLLFNLDGLTVQLEHQKKGYCFPYPNIAIL